MNKEEIIKRALIILHTTGYTNELEKSVCINAIEQLQQENKQLKDNWNKLKKHLWDLRNVALTKEFGNEWRECLSFNDDILPIINKMQELENGDSNE